MKHEKELLEQIRHGNPVQDIIFIVGGAFLFSASMNGIVLPHGMYSGGILGVAQLLRIPLDAIPMFDALRDPSGVIYFLLNLPLLYISWSRFGHKFFGKTVLCIVCYSVFLALLPIPRQGLLKEPIAACLIGGILCGIGAGLPLTAGCSGGGEEILGLLCMQHDPEFSVGRIALLINIVVYGTGLLVFDQDLVVYSVIFGFVTYLTLDRMHLQNVMVTMLIITKSKDMEQLVFQYAGRGVTKWSGSGAYSGEPSNLLLTVVSKKEALSLRHVLREHDPNVFVIMLEDTMVLGNFQKRLWG